MRYLLLALLASLLYLLGVALLYNAAGTLDLYLMPDALAAAPSFVVVAGLALISLGLLLKGAVFPLHVWLPQAHASAPGPVSAVLSALVVKSAIYLLYRLWSWSAGEAVAAEHALALLAMLGAGALLYGGVLALLQERLKLVIAYSTVAQLGYLLLILPMASTTAWLGGTYQLLTHGLAKAAMFLAAANILRALGSDRLADLQRLDQRQPLSLFALALAGVSIMGLPPSGGFLAKWLLLEAAWRGGHGWLLAVLVAGSLLAAAYVFRILAAALHRDDPAEARPVDSDVAIVPGLQTACALLLALLALVAGFAAAPILEFIEAGVPSAWRSP
jgi:formate hydrogenlyase subunit 3/multisubunit Na+/H+ antiporter MnhD subunit